VTFVAAGGVSIYLFRLRDVGGPLVRLRLPERAAREASSPLLRPPVVRLLYRQRVVLLIWAIAVALMAVYIASISHSIIDSLLSVPGLRAFLRQGTTDPYTSFIAIFWFTLAQVLIAGFAVHLVSFWASDDGEGILAAELSQPRRRWGIVFERFVAALIGIAVLAVIGSIVAALLARAGGTPLDTAGVARATALLVPFALTFSAVGAVGSVWWPRASVGVLGVVVFLSYLVSELGPTLQWPTWLTNTSPFALYGSPVLKGVYWTGFYVMVAIVLAGFAVATYLMQRRELTD
jgi:ABC-2 type transport system permease protein